MSQSKSKKPSAALQSGNASMTAEAKKAGRRLKPGFELHPTGKTLVLDKDGFLAVAHQFEAVVSSLPPKP